MDRWMVDGWMDGWMGSVTFGELKERAFLKDWNGLFISSKFVTSLHEIISSCATSTFFKPNLK